MTRKHDALTAKGWTVQWLHRDGWTFLDPREWMPSKWTVVTTRSEARDIAKSWRKEHPTWRYRVVPVAVTMRVSR